MITLAVPSVVFGAVELEKRPKRRGRQGGAVPLVSGAEGMTLPEILERLEQDASEHSTSGPCAEEDLQRLEHTLGRRLPASYRDFLASAGCGLYYNRHEIFGPCHVMIHDIELVPSLQSVRSGFPEGVLPVHRAEGVVHLLDLRKESRGLAPVYSTTGSGSYPDFAVFLERVILASAGRP